MMSGQFKEQVILKEHQIEGVKWCVNRERIKDESVKISGGIIADEMGLGKTIQMIGTMIANPLDKTLIVVPPMLIQQWNNEFKKVTDISPYIYHGKNINKLKIHYEKYVITSYDSISVHKKKMPNEAHKIKWNRIVFDEGHHLRNDNTCRFRGVSLLKRDCTWILSGTPVQNRIKDFYNLCSVLLLKKEFYMNAENLCIIGRKLIMKRSKHDVNVDIAEIEYSRSIVDIDDDYEEKLVEEIHKGLSFSNIKGNSVFDLKPLTAMLRAKQVCAYPSLIKKIVNENETLQLGTLSSSKLDKLVKQISENKDNGKGKLIFCEFRGEMDEIKARLEKMNMSVSILDGRTKSKEKDKIIRGNDDVIILQIKKGCEGLIFL